jgi:transcriptional regulator with XRE-family HTH domain/mannose-6-phosphate isomerase-like protein (cupin superfamily)
MSGEKEGSIQVGAGRRAKEGTNGRGNSRDGASPETIGTRVREERLRQKIGVRELARRVGVSASLISQVELGKASPSVGTLYAIVNQLGLSLDELLLHVPTARRVVEPARSESKPLDQGPGTKVPDAEAERPSAEPTSGVDPVVRHGAGPSIQLASGVEWERLAPDAPQDVDFLRVRYEVGSASCPEDALMRHPGTEYGHVISGQLGVTIAFETYELAAGDSISFDSTTPHRLFNAGETPVEAIWFVIGRGGRPSIVRS